MGFKQTLICPLCNYSAFTSGGPDRGFKSFKNTFVCRDCKALVDIAIDKEHWPELKSGQTCNSCKGENLESWDHEEKPCPKCQTSMNVDPNGMSMRWD